MTIEVTLSRPPASTTFEVGSFAEAVAILSENESQLIQLFTLANKMSGAATSAGGTEEVADAAGNTAPTETDAQRKKREKAAAKAAAAVAPAPLPVPTEPAAPVNTAPNANGIPAFLDRTAAAAPPPAPVAAAPAPPPPPPLPNAPPLAPAANTLASKVVAELEKRAKGSPDGGAALANWLASSGVTRAGTGYGEAIAAVALATDVQLGPVATALGVS